MKKIAICFFLLLTVCFFAFSQNSINAEILDNFYEYQGEIKDYFRYYYDEDYCGEMLYYTGRLMTIFGNIERGIISDGIIDFLIQLYNDALSLKVPADDREMYIDAGLGRNGHEHFIKIISIMYFMELETYLDDYSEEQKITARNGINRIKNLFTQQEWDLTVNYFRNKRNR